MLIQMASEEIGLVLTHRHRLDSSNTTTTSLNHHSHLLFQDDSHSAFHHHHHRSDHHPPAPTSNNSNKTTRELTGFIDHQHRYFPSQGMTDFRRNMYNAGPANHRGIQNWDGGNGRASNSPSVDGSDGDGEDDDDDEDDDGDGDVDGLVNSSDNKNNNSSNTSGHSSGEKIVNGNGKASHISSFGSIRDVIKDGRAMPSGDIRASSSDNHQQGQVSQYQNAVTIADPDGELYYSQYLQVADGSVSGLKDMVVENGGGISGRKDISCLGDSGESLRAIFSDPLTGILMDDAMILPCGHSFGSGGMQHVMRTKACYTCSHPVSDSSVASNLSLRSAIQAFRREEELQIHRASKRRRERSEQDKSSYGDSMLVDLPRNRGVQFPFSVTDRVIIKGNKRTPQRFVGREAVVTTQCLNGWYVVKTVDNAESVKLQYRSLAKVPDNLASKPPSSKVTPNWLS